MAADSAALRVLHLPTVVGGHAGHLSNGERALGLQSELLTLGVDNPFGYQEGRSLNINGRTTVLGKLGKLTKGFIDVRSKYDVFHFNYGTSLLHSPRFGLNLFDVPFYPGSSRLFVTYNGCDARQKFPTMTSRKWAACHDSNCYAGQCNSGQLDLQRRAGIEKMTQYAHHIWAVNPDLLNFLPSGKSSFLPYSISVGNRWPIPPNCEGVLRVAHAPTDRAAKGTQHVIDVCRALAERYPGRIELDLIENLVRERALDRLLQCDVLVDQLLIGWYGGVAIEAMLLGKAVIVRIENDDLTYIPAPMRSQLSTAFIQSDPDRLYATLEDCILERQRVTAAARSGLAYAKLWHDPIAVARITAAAYQAAFAR
ncbi:MAG: hypothetical protein V4858_11790 [Pseudomonadota bacterium]